jgi:hypothetical protein
LKSTEVVEERRKDEEREIKSGVRAGVYMNDGYRAEHGFPSLAIWETKKGEEERKEKFVCLVVFFSGCV